MALHLIKLCVGVDSVEQLQAAWAGRGRRTVHTRQTPKRAGELAQGGSLYWVIKGVVLCRQAVLEVRSLGEGATSRCEIELGLPVVRTAPAPRRPFQGWRYLTVEDAPPDLDGMGEAGAMPVSLAVKLREIGAW